MAEKYDKTIVGVLSGILLPFIIGLLIFLFSSHGMSFTEYLAKLSESGIITHSISICVFPNVVIFLIFNRFDMLRACRGVLAVTIIWAVIVFAVKFFG
ncbi:MAG TPA: hypothetical protein VK155_11720 [Bacteroidales bacterium]|jgi:hypothetical protein|nr:hypothetical protein [Bacteroidales bacterium]